MAMTGMRRWSQQVNESRHALDLPSDLFTQDDPKAIAGALKTSAEASRRRKTTPFRSAMAMLTFYINRAGSDLDKTQLDVLERAKEELRDAFGRARRE